MGLGNKKNQVSNPKSQIQRKETPRYKEDVKEPNSNPK